MDGRNSTGRKVSLLNDLCGGASSSSSSYLSQISTSVAHTSKFPSSTSANWSGRNISSIETQNCFEQRRSHSKSPSSASVSGSTPASSLSPQTPPLVRSESSDSRASAFATPSPLTPHFTSFDHAHHSLPLKHQQQQQQQQQPNPHHHHYLHRYSSTQGLALHPQHPVYYHTKMDHSSASMYPPLSDNSSVMAYSMQSNNAIAPSQPSATQQQSHAQQSQPRGSQSPTSDSIASAQQQQQQQQQPTKKNQYPCPMAKQFNCSDYFTTSGHAARHAKKHTGKKDAFCPECNKAFTRKDNMEQHRRTHQNVRGPNKNSSNSSTASNGDNRVKKNTKQAPRKSDSKLATASLEAAVAQQFEEQSAVSPQLASVSQPQQAPITLPQSVISNGAGPYFVSADPIQALPHPMPTDFLGRPPLYRSGYTNSLDFIPQAATTLPDATDLHFNYPSPGLSNGLNTLAMAASDHRRMSEEESSHSS